MLLFSILLFVLSSAFPVSDVTLTLEVKVIVDKLPLLPIARLWLRHKVFEILLQSSNSSVLTAFKITQAVVVLLVNISLAIPVATLPLPLTSANTIIAGQDRLFLFFFFFFLLPPLVILLAIATRLSLVITIFVFFTLFIFLGLLQGFLGSLLLFLFGLLVRIGVIANLWIAFVFTFEHLLQLLLHGLAFLPQAFRELLVGHGRWSSILPILLLLSSLLRQLFSTRLLPFIDRLLGLLLALYQ
mmetsp:Transcript_26589/g.48111  ORF Transcript_26589/g.48111 Transcript_26589/m.48111 type:complete len:243 (+) Transcript_26589:1132-1860(+)